MICHFKAYLKNGFIHNGKQKYACKDCGRQFIDNPQNKSIPQHLCDMLDKLLLEKIPIAGISRVTEISEPWLQCYVNRKYESVSNAIDRSKKGHLTVECDGIWSLVETKSNKQLIWLVIDRDSREIVWMHVGNRDRTGAKALWNSLPPIYRQCAVCYTDLWSAYEQIIPSKRHCAVGKESGKTNHIERFNLTLRQRVSRLVRKTLSFSKKIENHIGAIWNFIHHYNARIAPKLVNTTC